ncbi:MAG TPA: MaoC/PaaZ C-terminal domain-containing protein [Vicinamibacterales bacterium]|jgi:acyl dehydratase|nr:MaoC/PaaZ C-terminal domain-containing protein [Vicinamibacterales bacterium]
MALYFEDLEPSAPLGSRARAITESDVMAFADLTGDHSAIHTDDTQARLTKFGQRVAHGALVFSVSVGLATETSFLEGNVLAFAGVDKLRFVSPVFLGDSVHIVKRVLERRDVDAASGVVVFETRVLNQRDQLVLAYLDKILMKKRPATAAGTGSPS